MSDELFKMMVEMAKDYAGSMASITVIKNIVHAEVTKEKYPDATAIKIATALGMEIPEESDDADE